MSVRLSVCLPRMIIFDLALSGPINYDCKSLLHLAKEGKRTEETYDDFSAQFN